MQATFNESDIQSLLTKVKIFNHQIGTYELYTINDAFHYVVKLSNGTIFFTTEELEANASESLNLEMLTSITRRFTPTSSPDESTKADSMILPANTVTENQNAKPSSAKNTLYAILLALIGLAIGVLAYYVVQ